jgi:hypothetical protein
MVFGTPTRAKRKNEENKSGKHQNITKKRSTQFSFFSIDFIPPVGTAGTAGPTNKTSNWQKSRP